MCVLTASKAIQITVAMLVTDIHDAMSMLKSEEVGAIGRALMRSGAQELAEFGERGRMRSDVGISIRYYYLRRKCNKQRRRAFASQKLGREVRPLGLQTT